MLRKIWLVVLVLTLTACANMGGSSEDRMSRTYLEQHLTIGKSTKADVKALYGEPEYKSESSDKQDYWSYSEDQINGNFLEKAMSYMPSLGTVGDAAADTQKRKTSRDLNIHFNANGTLRSYNTSGSTGAGS